MKGNREGYHTGWAGRKQLLGDQPGKIWQGGGELRKKTNQTHNLVWGLGLGVGGLALTRKVEERLMQGMELTSIFKARKHHLRDLVKARSRNHHAGPRSAPNRMQVFLQEVCQVSPHSLSLLYVLILIPSDTLSDSCPDSPFFPGTLPFFFTFDISYSILLPWGIDIRNRIK